MSYTISEKVANSIALLDRYAGGADIKWLPVNWRELIDLGWLDMSSTTSCILGQLRKAESGRIDGYGQAIEALETAGADPYNEKYEFCDGTSVWRMAIKDSMNSNEPRVGITYYLKVNPQANRTVMSISKHDGTIWVTFSWESSDTVRGVRVLTLEELELDKWTTEKPKLFKNGDELLDGGGRSYYYFSDEKVIRVEDGNLGWAALAYYEKESGPLVKKATSSARHFFSNTFFKLDK